MIKTKKHMKDILKTWEVSFQDWIMCPSKRLASFKASRGYRDEFLDRKNKFLEEKAYNAIAFLCITAISSLPKYEILKNRTVVKRLHDTDRYWLSLAIFEQVVFFVKNDTQYEKITGQSLSTPNFQFSNETTRNLITSDVLGTYTKMCLKNSEITKYKLLETEEEANICFQNKNGLIQFIAKIGGN